MLVKIREFLFGVAVFAALLTPMFMTSFDDASQHDVVPTQSQQ